MTKPWPDCIVTLIDVIGIKRAARIGGSMASNMMRRLHSLVKREFENGMPEHASVYCWNDSVLLLAYWNKERQTGRRILAEASNLKRLIDQKIGDRRENVPAKRSYAISIKGQAFPDYKTRERNVTNDANPNSRCVVIRASSYAMANCFSVEEAMKRLEGRKAKKYRSDWYVDHWLKKAVERKPRGEYEGVAFLPSGRKRKVLLFDGYL